MCYSHGQTWVIMTHIHMCDRYNNSASVHIVIHAHAWNCSYQCGLISPGRRKLVIAVREGKVGTLCYLWSFLHQLVHLLYWHTWF